MSSDPLEIMYYAGPSMTPALKSGDMLFIAPQRKGRVNMGDVVVFASPLKGEKVVHRVASISLRGIRTKGDNNGNVDPWVLQPAEILGRVVCVKSRGKLIKVRGGFAGRLLIILFWIRRRIRAALSHLRRGVL